MSFALLEEDQVTRRPVRLTAGACMTGLAKLP